MSFRTLRGLLPAACLSLSLNATAQAPSSDAATPLRPDPLDARAAVPTLVTASPFAKYRRLGDDTPVPWREANDTVARIGGWRAYAREAAAPDAAASAPAAMPASGQAAQPAQPKPAPPAHAGHGTH